MNKRQILIGIMLSTFLLFGCINKSRKVENIRCFAKVYGYVRWFYPSDEAAKIDWGNELTSTIQNTLLAKSEIEYFNVLRLFVAKLEDGHASVTKKLIGFGLPLKYDLIESNIVVTDSRSDEFQKGDIIKSIDGKSGLEEFEKQKSFVSGSPRYKRYMALISFGMDFNGNEANLSIIRNGKEIIIKTQRHSFSEMSSNPFATESFKIIDCGDSTVYLKGEPIDINLVINKLVSSKAIILSSRTDDSRQKFIAHIIKEPIYGIRAYVPIFTYPDREKMYFDHEGSMPIYPEKPFINAKLVFLTYPDNISHEETYLDFIDHYKLAKLVGDTTAGCNGSRNTIPLIGGYSISFTGMKVLKRDSSQLYLIGYNPDYPVNRTIKGIIENRDEYLDKALEILKK